MYQNHKTHSALFKRIILLSRNVVLFTPVTLFVNNRFQQRIWRQIRSSKRCNGQICRRLRTSRKAGTTRVSERLESEHCSVFKTFTVVYLSLVSYPYFCWLSDDFFRFSLVFYYLKSDI